MLAKLAFLLSITAPKHHVVTGVYPTVTLTYAPWVIVHVAYPAEGGHITRYADSFRVAEGPLVRDLLRRGADADVGTVRPEVRVTLERDGDKEPWHLTHIDPL